MAWQGLIDTAPHLSEVEVHFEKRKQLVGLWLGPALCLAAMISPPLQDVTPVGMRTLGIFLWTVAWWIGEPVPIPVTSLLSLAMLVLFGVLSVDAAFSTWSNWVIIFLIGACVIGHAMNLHGLTRRIAYHVATARIVAEDPWRVLLLFGLGSALMSSALSHVVTTIIFLAIAVGLVKALNIEQGSRYAEALFLAIAWGSNMGVLTPVGAPTNLIAIGMASTLGYRIGFLQWVIICLPVFVVSLAAMYVVLRYVIRPEMPDWRGSQVFLQEELKKLGAMTPAEKIAAGVFCTALFLWVIPDILPLVLPAGRLNPISVWVTRHLDWSVTAVIMAASLFVIPLDWNRRKFAMTWDEAVRGVEWGTLCLIAAALALGNTLAHNTLGLGQFFQANVSAFIASSGSPFLFIVGVVAFTVIVGSVVSNLAIVSMVGALVQGLPASADVNPIALLVAVALAANMDFALPIGTPPSAIVFASGYVRIGTMIRGGTILALLSIGVVSLLGYYMAAWVLS